MVETSERERVDLFELYNRTFKSWMDIYDSWTRPSRGFMPGFGSPVMDDWTRMYRGFSDVMKIMPVPFDFMKDMNESFARNMNSGMRIYYAWFKGLNNLAGEWWEICRRAGSGDDVNTEKYLQTMRGAYDDISNIIVDSLKDTPLAGIKHVDNAMKEALSSLPEEQQMARDYFQKLMSFNVRLMNISLSAMKSSSSGISRIIEKGAISGNGFQETLDSYSDMIKDSLDILQQSTALPARSGDIASEFPEWTKSCINLSVACFEFNMKLCQGAYKSIAEAYKVAEGLLKDARATSPEQMYKFWWQLNQKTAGTVLDNSHYFEGMSRCISCYTDWMKASSKLYQSMMTPPYVSREEWQKMSDELQKLHTAIERKSRTKSE